MTILEIFNYDGNIKNPVSKRINIKERLFEENEYAIVHIYPSYNLLFIESKQRLHVSDISIEGISSFSPSRDMYCNFLRQISSCIISLYIVGLFGDENKVKDNDEINKLLQNRTKPIRRAKFRYEGEQVKYYLDRMHVPDNIQKTDLMLNFARFICN